MDVFTDRYLHERFVRAPLICQGGSAFFLSRSLSLQMASPCSEPTRRFPIPFPRPLGFGPDRKASTIPGQYGDADALEAIDFRDNPEEHPGCGAVLEEVSSRTSGREVREAFTTAPYGWPQDAIDSALVLHTLTGHVRTRQNGEAVDAPDLTQRNIGTARFRAETVTLSKRQMLEVLNVLQTMTDATSGEELEKVSEFLQEVRRLADRVSGPPPLPSPPELDYVDDVERHSGNERLAKLHENKERFLKETGEWQSMLNRKSKRETEWSQLQTALRRADGIDGVEEIKNSTVSTSCRICEAGLNQTDVSVHLITEFSPQKADVRYESTDLGACPTYFFGRRGCPESDQRRSEGGVHDRGGGREAVSRAAGLRIPLGR